MKAIIMSAGRGKRLRPITDSLPKPMVTVGEKPLIQRHIEALKQAGISEIVINLGHLGSKIRNALGNGQQFGVNIAYTYETQLLEVGGGIANALPLLGSSPFIVVNGDIWTDYNFLSLKNRTIDLGHVVLVPNPQHHLNGDYGLIENEKMVLNNNIKTYTYSGIALYHPQLFENISGVQMMKPILDEAISRAKISGELYRGRWADIGTITRLQTLRQCVVDCSAFRTN